ncbi:MAG: DUF1156 domain-containing protein [Deltaproteobacteria bacterium]|jgi:adenine-specific DNA methylase|nr:DUF1156 domain-containing protein [Deltaproteobacteria bacterium]
MIENNFDVSFVANKARREKQIQQNYRPIIGVHKWFARRPGTLFRALLLAEFSNLPLEEAFFKAGELNGKTIGDPFMGGGAPLLEANRMGANVQGCDINPMAYWVVRREIERLDIMAYLAAADDIYAAVYSRLGSLYHTNCGICGSKDAYSKYYLWVKTTDCHKCGQSIDLFPGFLVAENNRHPLNVFVCPTCGQLSEITDRKNPGHCAHCKTSFNQPIAKGNKKICPFCGTENKYPNGKNNPLNHRLFAIEYHCPKCHKGHKGRFFKAPDSDDLAKYSEAESIAAGLNSTFIPEDLIPPGDETNRLHRWGYSRYRELFNARQLVGLEAICQLVSQVEDDGARQALATNLSDLLRYQNMLCRYDTSTLKSLDIFSIHGFPVGLIQCESNLLGVSQGGKLFGNGGKLLGSGGWLNIVEKYKKAKVYCDSPFEIRDQGFSKTNRKSVAIIQGEWIGDHKIGSTSRRVDLACMDASGWIWRKNSLDGVFTDPPYFGNVQYAELMDFCYVWLRLLVPSEAAFHKESCRNIQELTGNNTLGRGIERFTEGLSNAFRAVAKALKPGAPFVFTYHHNDISAYFPIAVAILDAGLVCSKVLPCPTEMRASIHIHGTLSSTVDSVFVCRRGEDFANFVKSTLENDLFYDIKSLKNGGLNVTNGDIRCVIFGHMIMYLISALASDWNKDDIVTVKLDKVSRYFQLKGGMDTVQDLSQKALLFISQKEPKVIQSSLF